MIIKRQGNTTKSERIKDLLFFLLLVIWPLVQFLVFYIFVNFNSIRIAFIGIDGKFTFSNFGLWFGANWPVFSKAILQSLKYFAICTGVSIPLALLFSYYIYYTFYFVCCFPSAITLESFSAFFACICSYKSSNTTGILL